MAEAVRDLNMEAAEGDKLWKYACRNVPASQIKMHVDVFWARIRLDGATPDRVKMTWLL